jgi:hypothetical protein
LLQRHIKWLPEAITPFQLQPSVHQKTYMQVIPVATKMAILQPNIGVGQGIIPSSAVETQGP